MKFIVYLSGYIVSAVVAAVLLVMVKLFVDHWIEALFFVLFALNIRHSLFKTGK